MVFALFLVSLLMVLAATAVLILMAAGSINSRHEEEYWTAYWLDTPTTDSVSDVIFARLPLRTVKADGVRKAA